MRPILTLLLEVGAPSGIGMGGAFYKDLFSARCSSPTFLTHSSQP